ncbi:MAG: hypothetical protein U0103_23110 [Candidatus Obscuribacterales bacterium]
MMTPDDLAKMSNEQLERAINAAQQRQYGWHDSENRKSEPIPMRGMLWIPNCRCYGNWEHCSYN